jgi:hypothetical protein
MKLFLSLVGLIFIFCVLASPIIAQTSAVRQTVDMTQLTETQKAEIMKIINNKESPASEWARNFKGIGKEIGEALNETARALTINVNEFAKTPVGNLTTVLLVYKIIGKEVIRLIIATLAWIIISSLILWSFYKFHVPYRVVEEDPTTKTKKIRFIQKYEFKTNEARVTSASMHAICFGVLTGVCLLVGLV